MHCAHYSSISLSSKSSSHTALSSVSFETFWHAWHGQKSRQDSLADIHQHCSVSHWVVLRLQWTSCKTLSGFVVIHGTANSPSSMCHPLPMGEGADILPVRQCFIHPRCLVVCLTIAPTPIIIRNKGKESPLALVFKHSA